MSNLAISAAFATRLNEVGLPTKYENADFTPPVDGVYLAESLVPSDVVPIGIANGGSDALMGFYQVLIYAPLGGTKGAAFTGADDVAGYFMRGDRLSASGVTVTILRTVIGASFQSGDRFVIPISIYYRAVA